MKITEKKLRQIIREEMKPRSLVDMPRLPLSNEPVEDKLPWTRAQEDMKTKLMRAINSGKARVAPDSAGPAVKSNTMYIMTGDAEGITVQILRKGR